MMESFLNDLVTSIMVGITEISLGISIIIILIWLLARKKSKKQIGIGFNKILLAISFFPFLILLVLSFINVQSMEGTMLEKWLSFCESVLWELILFLPFFVVCFLYQISCLIKVSHYEKQQKEAPVEEKKE